MANFKEILVNSLLPVVQAMVTEQLVSMFNQFAKNDPTSYALVVNEMYVPVDTHLEELVKKSKGKADDVAVGALKSALEQSASENNVELQNLDKD